MATRAHQLQAVEESSLLVRTAARFGVDATKLMTTLKATAFRVKDGEATNEQMMALLVVSEQYGLNPFTKELFAFPDKGGIVPVVSVDGWCRIINDHPEFDGVDFADGPEDDRGAPQWIECVIYRKDRAHPTKIRERMNEVRRDTQPWKTHPSRMLRHKALIQCARVAFGFAGIFDQDEAERIVGSESPFEPTKHSPLRNTIQRKSAKPTEAEIIEGDAEEVPTRPSPLENYLEELKRLTTEEDIDRLNSLAREALTESSYAAFCQSAAVHIRKLSQEGE